MNTTRGKLKHFSLVAIWGVIAKLARPYLPDDEVASYLWVGGYMMTYAIVDFFWPDDEPDHTPQQVCLVLAFFGLVLIWVMWLPDGDGFRRSKSMLPFDLSGRQWAAAGLLLGFLVSALVAHRILVAFERQIYRALCIVYAGMVAIDAFLPADVLTFFHVTLAVCVLGMCGFWGREFPQMVFRLLSRPWQPSGVFGRARFADKLSDAEQAGLRRPGQKE